MKVLLIEDRQKRQEQFLENSNVLLSGYPMLSNATGIEYKKFKKNILDDKRILEKYDIIISHRSAFDKDNAKVMDIIEEYCITNSKKMVLFSGGIYSSYYQAEPFEKLSLNSKILYSQNLRLFLDNLKNKDEVNLHILAYGENWEVNLLLMVVEKINILLRKGNDFINGWDFDDLNDFTNLEIIKNYINIENLIEKDTVSRKDIDTVRDDIMNFINKKLDLHYV
jgi:hypothetical protein